MQDSQLQKLLDAYGNLGTIAVLGLFGVILLTSLLWAWRRYSLRRSQFEARRAAHRRSMEQDLWKLGGKRLAAMLTPPPPEPDLHIENDEAEDEDEDEDEDREWWQKGGG